MKKYILGVMVAVALAIPTTSVVAQTYSEDQYRNILIQLIISLQKQIALLTSGQVQQTSSNVTDRCPNIGGIQFSVPSGLVYTRTFDKCVNEHELDELEDEVAEDDGCEISEDGVDELRKEYSSIEDEIERITKDIPKASKGTIVELKEVHVSRFLENLSREYNSSIYSDFAKDEQVILNCGELGKECKGGIYYSSDVFEKGREIKILEDELKELDTKIWRAEVEVKVDCD